MASKDRARLFGLIGYPLGHSFSKAYFSEKFKREDLSNCTYELFPLKRIEELPDLLRHHPHLEGLNVTIPYKEAVLPFLDAYSSEAEQIGAVNTIRIREGLLKGFNTDAFGFEQSLREHFFPDGFPAYLQALILGSGGASRAVRYVLQKEGVPFRIVSRKQERGDLTYEQLSEEVLQSHHLIVNTTPLGMHPREAQSPDIPYRYLGVNHYLYDLVYNPSKPVFLKKGEAQGSRILNGLRMLHLQADRAWSVWNDSMG